MSDFDLEAIKLRVTLRSLLERDGVELRRAGATFVCCCPIHREKTPSFHLHEENAGDWFHCFGCGAGSDIFDYWKLTRSVDFIEAKAALAAIAGISASAPPAPLPPRERIDRPKQVRPMEQSIASRWRDGVEFLKENEGERARIAAWRGYRMETVDKMVADGHMGLPIYFGKRREGFPVWVPASESENGDAFQAGYHVRTPEMEGRFRFEPKGIGSWPFVIGDVEGCKALVILEGQWDAIAFYDAVSEGEEFPRDVAVVGIRGAKNWKKMLAYDWPQRAQAFVFTDGDEAGQDWLEADNLSGELRKRCKAVHAFTWGSDRSDCEVKDFNDAHREWASRLTGSDWRAMLRSYYTAGLRARLSRRGGRG